MKKLFIFLLVGLFISISAQAQTRTRKVPFLPYAGMAVETVEANHTSSGTTTRSAPVSTRQQAIFFEEGTAELRKGQRKKLIALGKKMEKSPSAFYTVVGFTSPEIPDSLARERVQTIVQALADFKIGDPIASYEHRTSPVLNPNRVEVYF